VIATYANSFSQLDILLESYKKVSESIGNRTNNTQSQNFSSSTSSRRNLYRKGDSCNEDQLDDPNEPSNQPPFEMITMPSNIGEVSTKRSVKPNEDQKSIPSDTTASDQNDVSIRTTESHRVEILHKTGSAQIQQNDVEDPLSYAGDAELVLQMSK